jgi:hypothetical protein
MRQIAETQIRERAHHLWEQAGRPEGRDDEFWHLAEQLLLQEDAGPSGHGDEAKQPR